MNNRVFVSIMMVIAISFSVNAQNDGGSKFHFGLKASPSYNWMKTDGTQERVKISELLITEALERVPALEAHPGDIIAVAGIETITLGETLADNENPHVNNTLTALQNYHDELKDVFADTQDAFKEFADLLGLKNAASSRSFLLSRKCSEIQAVDGKASASLIRGYLELAAKTAQNPRIIYTTPLKLKDLDKIVKSLGVDWEESFRSFANRVQIDAEMIERGICAIHFKNVGNRGVSSSDVLDAMEDGDVNNVLNIYHAQLNWLTKGWTSNIEHLTTTGKTLDRIEYLIWIEKETLYPALLELVGDDNSDQD